MGKGILNISIEQNETKTYRLSANAAVTFSIFYVLSLTRYVMNAALCYTARLPFTTPSVSNAPHRSYTVEDFTDLINASLLRLERRKEAQQRYGGLLVVLRQQVEACRLRRSQ